MRDKILVGLILLTGLGTAVARADEWTKTYSVTGRPELQVETNDGNVHIRVWDRNQIEARVSTVGWSIGEDGVRIRGNQAGNLVELDVRIPNTNWGFGHHSVNIELSVPREDLLKVHTGDGNIDLSGVHGEMRLTTGDGRIEAESLDGTLSAKSGDGHISARGRFDTLHLESGDGRIEAEAAAGSRMASDWSLHSGDGNVSLRLPGDFSADLDAHTGDGHITVDFPMAVQGSLGGSTVRGKLNGGGLMLTVHTGDGSIHIEKQ